jgi:hypothetical protein
MALGKSVKLGHLFSSLGFRVQERTISTVNGVGFFRAIVALKLNPLTGGFMRSRLVMLNAPCEFRKSAGQG